MINRPLLSALAALSLFLAGPTLSFAEEKEISYEKDIKPIFQANCLGCHQPARSEGDFVMTNYEGLLKAGESGTHGIVPGKPKESYLLDEITPVDGKAEMPKGKKPLAENEINLIKKWIAQGAKNDSVSEVPFSKSNLPTYSSPAVITSIDFSPDGKLIAMSGLNEVLLVDSKSHKVADRLIGLSRRITSVKFSPDGKRLLATGGTPSRMGEVQVWDVAKRTLLLSHSETYDILYGGSWSPDGKLIAFGCTDNTVRAIDSKTGKQVLFQGAHGDWPLETVFSNDNTHLISVSRDMTVKLTEVKSERFVDNITSITPGALKGGVNAIAMHPERDDFVIGGSDGSVKVYRIYRQTKRVIGDDANQIRTLPSIKGRVFSVDVSKDGKRIAAGSSLDGQGQVAVYSYEFETKFSDEMKKILGTRVASRSAKDKEKVAAFRNKDVKQLFVIDTPESSIYSVQFSTDGKTVAAAGTDGSVRMFDATTGKLLKTWLPSVFKADDSRGKIAKRELTFPEIEISPSPTTKLPSEVVELQVEPKEINLSNQYEYSQLLVSAILKSGERIDQTRDVKFEYDNKLLVVSREGILRPLQNGSTTLKISSNNKKLEVPVIIQGLGTSYEVDFIRDVNPVLSKVGCNQGTCHGSAKGKGGFKLSLRGYDPIFDIRTLTDDLASRRTNPASPQHSLMLQKPTGGVPHVGGVIMKKGEPYYEILEEWIFNGAKLNLKTARVSSISLSPENPVIQEIGRSQQVRVIATYDDGSTRDVTKEAFISSGNTEVSTAGVAGLMTSVRRGEAPVLARYEGAYATTTLTVMGNRSKFVWKQPEFNNKLDELTAEKWKRLKILPSELCTDEEFIRRISFDLTGLPPTPEDVRKFVADKRDSKVKRDGVIQHLVGSNSFIDHWSNKWADLMQVNGKFLGRQGATGFRSWIRDQVAKNTPYNKFVYSILTAKGSNKENPAASYYKILRTPEETVENTTHVFLGVRFNCNKCHDHPFERWTQDQYYETAAYFAQVGLKSDPKSKGFIGGTAVESRKPLFEVVYDKNEGEVKHDRTGEVAPPKFPYECDFDFPEKATRREQLAAWMTSADNPYFARSYVNRLWGYLLGVGIIEPIDDIRAGNPATNPELLEHLTEEFIKSNFDARHIIKLICQSRTYQLSIKTNQWNADDTQNYSHAMARRLPAEVLYDAVHVVTGTNSKFPGVPAGTRAAALPDSGISLPSDFLNKFGRPVRESACECERSENLQLGQVMALINGPTIAAAIANDKNHIAKMVGIEKDDKKLVNELFMRILNRPAKDSEIKAALESFSSISNDHTSLVASLKKRSEYFAPIREELKKKREAKIVKVKADLESYKKKIAPEIAKKEAARLAKLKKLQAELKKLEADAAKKIPEWEKKNKSNVEWHPLLASSLTASKGLKLTSLEDRSIMVSGKTVTGTYNLVFPTSLQNITAVRLEAIPDKTLPGGGPGTGYGNFVVSEFGLRLSPKKKPKEMENIRFSNAYTPFSQANYNVKNAIDGQAGGTKGWAVSPAQGVVHWAVFEVKKPIQTSKDGSYLRITINQNYRNSQHLLGRFRISVTTNKLPVGVSLPDSLQAIVSTPEKERTKTQKETLLTYFQRIDSTIGKKRSAVSVANAKLPVDPGVTKREERLAIVSKPIVEDGLLLQLQKDVVQSEKQIKNERLTAAQDLTWALINTPAFLFNH